MDVINKAVNRVAPFLRAVRRDLHTYPETAWLEFRTASLVAAELTNLGFKLTMGDKAAKAASRPFIPAVELRRAALERALAEGADPSFAQIMFESGTAIWAEIEGCGPPDMVNHGIGTDAASKGFMAESAAKAGSSSPVLAFRFDMDANKIGESGEGAHRPHCEGFASTHAGIMHACGHDGHTAIGLGLARVLKELQGSFRGKIRLIFQPAEEGGGGALPMLESGALDDVNCLVGLHLGIRAAQLGDIICGSTGFLSTSKFDVFFEGLESHAGLKPHEGKNALMAACSAALAMQGVPRHGAGASRICVGRLSGGQARNAIPAGAEIHGETRGYTDEINSFMISEVMRMAEGAAKMWNCSCRTMEIGHCPGGDSSPELAGQIAELAATMPVFGNITTLGAFGASEDFTHMMNHVQKSGGQAAFIQLGAGHIAGHHNCLFDFDEAALAVGVELLARLVKGGAA